MGRHSGSSPVVMHLAVSKQKTPLWPVHRGIHTYGDVISLNIWCYSKIDIICSMIQGRFKIKGGFAATLGSYGYRSHIEHFNNFIILYWPIGLLFREGTYFSWSAHMRCFAHREIHQIPNPEGFHEHFSRMFLLTANMSEVILVWKLDVCTSNE